MTAPLLRIEHLEVRYGDLIGVSDVSLDVPEGSVVALLGSNGGGKTTVLNAVAGLIPLYAGSIEFRGQAIGGRSAFAIVREGLALSPEGWRLFVQQSVENNLKLGATPLNDKRRTATLLDRVYEHLSEIGGATPSAGRHHVRRRAPDAGGRPRADERSEASDAG